MYGSDEEKCSDNSSDDDEEVVVAQPKKKKVTGKLRIRELDLNNIHPLNDGDVKNGCRLVLIGKPGVGKSSVIESIFYAKKHIIPVAQVFSGTEEQNGFFKKFIPSTFIFNDLSASNVKPIEDFEMRQRLAIKYLEKDYNPWSILVTDDCMSNPKILKKEVFQKIFKNGRHYRILYMLSLQFALDLEANIRSTIDGTFIFRESSPTVRKKIYENFAGCVGDFKLFCLLMDTLTQDYSCLYIDNKSTSNRVEDCVFFYKADLTKIPQSWRFGCREYWKYHEARFDHEKDQDDNSFLKI